MCRDLTAPQVRKIADESYTVALKHIRDNREAIDYIVDELIEKETITGEVRGTKTIELT